MFADKRAKRVGDILTGKIVRLTEFGAFVELFDRTIRAVDEHQIEP